MKPQTSVGIACLVVALATWASNMSDTVTDLQSWHQAGTPHVIGVCLKQTSTLLFTIAGGVLMPQPRRRQPVESEEKS